MHCMILPFLLMNDITHLYFWVLLFYQNTFIRILYLSLFDNIIFFNSIFTSVMLYINPKFIFIAKDFQYFDLMFTLLQFFSNKSIKFRLNFLIFLYILQLKLIQTFLLQWKFFNIFTGLFDKLRLLLRILFFIIFLFKMLLMKFSLNFLIFYALEMNSLHDQLPLDRKQMLNKGWLCDQFQFIRAIDVVNKVLNDILQFNVLFQVHDIHFSSIVTLCIVWLDQLTIQLVIICEQMIQFSIVNVQPLHNSGIIFLFDVKLLHGKLIKFAVINIKLILFYLHVNECQSFFRQRAQLIKLHLLPAQLPQFFFHGNIIHLFYSHHLLWLLCGQCDFNLGQLSYSLSLTEMKDWGFEQATRQKR